MGNDIKNVSGGVFANKGEDFQVRSDTPLVGFKVDCVDPPSYEYVEVEDILQISGSANQGGATVTVNLRIMRADGTITTIQFVAPLNGFAASAATRFNLPEGYILSGTAIYTGNTAPGFHTYLIVSLARQQFGILGTYKILFEGYVFGTIPVSFEGSPTQRPTDGQGYPLRTAQAAPAAGTESIYTVPGSTRERLCAWSATLVTSAVAANRVVSLVIDDGANILAVVPSNNTQLASTTARYTFADGATLVTAAAGNNYQASPANMILPTAFRIRTLTAGLDVGDQWSIANMLMTEWLDSN